MKKLLLSALILLAIKGHSQNHGFSFGQVALRELDMKIYEKDTTASAVVLDEFGEAYIDNGNNYNLLFEYHVKIKILKPSGLEKANFEIPLYKQKENKEILKSVKASSFNRSETGWTEEKLDTRNVFTENRSKYYDFKKFAVPNVRVGSVIEISYLLESPYIFNFRRWEFQAEIPKIRSEYWATIPGNYIYNMSLKGFLNLQKNESEIIADCFAPGGNRADCARYKYAMKNVPALVEEDYMLAKSNFLASINFELSEIKYFDGRVNKFTKEWKDAEEEMRKDDKFGLQIKRGKDIVEDQVALLLSGETDELNKAKKIYEFIRSWYQWNEVYGMNSEFGIKKAFASKKGNVGDINLSLVAALKYAGLDVEPVILSTRLNGLPIEIHPVLSDFNYVIAKVNIGGKSYLLDATDDFLLFGMIPERCINGKGRVLGNKESYWIDLKPTDKNKQISMFTLKLEKDGFIRGKIQNTYLGYEAVNKRKEIKSFSNESEYFDDLKKKHDGVEISNFEVTNVDDFTKPVREAFDVEISVNDNLQSNLLLFNPFILEKWEANPFKSRERLYPVDFGVPIEETVVLSLEYPEEFQINDFPETVGLSLPNSGGRYVFDVQNAGNKLTLNSNLVISRTIYSSQEYHYLKELFNRIVTAQNTDIVFNKK